jgi:5-carboxymethyl-2-hydroxymuconate isomerase
MPHLVIEHSPNLDCSADPQAVCQAAHEALRSSGLFPIAGIRVRAHRAEHSIVADGLPQNAFVAMTLSVGAGRAKADLKTAGDALFAAVQAVLAQPLATPHFALSLEIRVIDPDLSWKDTPIHARLSGRQ